MKKQIRNALLVVAALLLVVLFYFLPNIQAALVDKKTFGQSEDLSLNPVEISVEATQTTLEKLKIINNHILSVAVRPSSRTVDGRDIEKTAKKQTNLLLKKMKIAYRVDEDWKITYKKLYTYIKKKDDMIDEGSVSNISNVKNLLVWYITLSPESSEDEIVNLIMDAYTDQILAIDVYSYDYTKDWKDIADHLEDIPAGFLSYLNLKQSEYNLKKHLMGNVNVTEQYQKAKSAKGSYSQISGRIGIYAIQNKKQTYIPIEWSGYGFMINNVYNN